MYEIGFWMYEIHKRIFVRLVQKQLDIVVRMQSEH